MLLQANPVTQDEIQHIEKQVQAEIEEAVKYALQSPHPAPEEALEDVYA
jgi:TPP-dependent pyruvate/acetoin dehydrogenase alpha subunit